MQKVDLIQVRKAEIFVLIFAICMFVFFLQNLFFSVNGVT
jgi:hypothetical protein